MQGLDSYLSELTSGNDQRAEVAIPALVRLGQPAVTALLKLLDEKDPDHRWWAIRALSEFDHPAVTDALSRSLMDPDPGVQHCAALGLRENPSSQAISFLVQTLQSEDRLLSRLSGDALAAIGKGAISALSECLQSSDPALRGQSARALALMEEPESIPHLFSAAEDPSAIVQHWIQEGFERLGVGMVFFKP